MHIQKVVVAWMKEENTQATKILEPYTSSFTVQKSEHSVLARPQAELVLHTPGRAGVPLITQILRTEN